MTYQIKLNLNGETLPLKAGEVSQIEFDAPVVDAGELIIRFQATEDLTVSLNGWKTVGNTVNQYKQAYAPVSLLTEQKNTLRFHPLKDDVVTSADVFIVTYPTEVTSSLTETVSYTDYKEFKDAFERADQVLELKEAPLEDVKIEEVSLSINEAITYPEIDFTSPSVILEDGADPVVVLPPDPEPDPTPDPDPQPVPVTGDFPWVPMHYQGNQTNDLQWITDHPDALRRNAMYYVGSGVQYDNAQTVNDNVVYGIAQQDPAVQGWNYLDFEASITKSPKVFRGQVQTQYNQFVKSDTNKVPHVVRKGWDNWWTAPGQEAICRFSFRVPTDMKITDWPSISNKPIMDNPISLQIFQWRTRYHDDRPGNLTGVTKKPINIPMHLYWQQDYIWLDLQNDDRTKKWDDTLGTMGPVVAKITPGQWIDFVVYVRPGIAGDGSFELHRRYRGIEDDFTLVYKYDGDLYGTVEDRFIGRHGNGSKVNEFSHPGGGIPRYCMGFPSWGMYPSVRLRNYEGAWTRAGISEIKLNYSHLDFLQGRRGEFDIDAVLADTVKNWK